MDKRQIIELTGLISVVASLAFVGFEIRQTRVLFEAQPILLFLIKLWNCLGMLQTMRD